MEEGALESCAEGGDLKDSGSWMEDSAAGCRGSYCLEEVEVIVVARTTGDREADWLWVLRGES